MQTCCYPLPWKSDSVSCLCTPNHKLILTASVQTGIKPEIRVRAQLYSFTLDGWTVEEYKTAMSDAEFAAEHEDLMDDDCFEAKHSYAGASARWMFGTWPQFIFALGYYVASSDDTEPFKGFKVTEVFRK